MVWLEAYCLVVVRHCLSLPQLKECLEGETGVVVSEQTLSGWPDSVPVSDEVCGSCACPQLRERSG